MRALITDTKPTPEEADPVTQKVHTRTLPLAALIAVGAVAALLFTHRDAGAGPGPSIVEHPLIRPAAAHAERARRAVKERHRPARAPVAAVAARTTGDAPAAPRVTVAKPRVAAPPRRGSVPRHRARPLLRAEVHVGPIAATGVPKARPRPQRRPRPAAPAPAPQQPETAPAQQPQPAEQSPPTSGNGHGHDKHGGDGGGRGDGGGQNGGG
ncbi:MAG: hypothetical protein E6G10_23760 [Actinobacteria bacterium]|nr:MAG: hypothetical protein E6G10_23760 [Actinomycetota bacterium]